MGKIRKLDREIVANCPRCKQQLFYVLLNKPRYTTIIGFQCSFCGDIVSLQENETNQALDSDRESADVLE